MNACSFLRNAIIVLVALILLGTLVPSNSSSSRSWARAGPTSPANVPSEPRGIGPLKSEAEGLASSGDGPHPGTLEIWEFAPEGQTSEDPSVAYDTVSEEPILNVYQTLVTYNGSSTADFVPELSTCVPGLANGAQSTPSVSCQAVYGNSLIVNGPSGAPEYFTYPIDPEARFYDPATTVSWPVYPSDVMFTIARTLGFSDLPSPGTLNGWIQAESLLPIGSGWDNHLHYPFNNTPQHVLGSMLINDSTYCPASALAASGCITFNASGEGVTWPFFNQLVADSLGASVEPCGWFTAQSAGVPGFPGSAAAHGDGPCLLPGNAYNTSASGFTNFLATEPLTAWDTFEQLALNHPAVQPGVQFNLVGSGPYYIAPGQDVPTVGYTLQASPAYQQPTGCVGVGGGCEPAVGGYGSTAVVHYEANYTPGEEQYLAGQADTAPVSPCTTPQCILVQLFQAGKIGIWYLPTLTTNFFSYSLQFNSTVARSIVPSSSKLNVSSDFFASNTVRNFLNRAWPYTTILETLWTTGGIWYGFAFGGAIPAGMGDYYPTNISWPYLGGDPDSNTTVGSAHWWWTEGTTPGSPYYDPELAACTSATPCTFPVGTTGARPGLESAIQLWISSVETITSNAVQPAPINLEPCFVLCYLCGDLYTSCLPIFDQGWAPDYPDPTDYMAAMYYANGTYTLGDATYQTMEVNASYNAANCGHTADTWADLVYWANFPTSNGTGPALPVSCQGPAYGQMLYWMGIAASLPVGNYRILVYNEVEHIENQLGLYLYDEEMNGLETYARWINPLTINANPMIGGATDQTWYSWGYASDVVNVTFNETGLSPGTLWRVTYAGTVHSSTTSTIVVDSQTNGTYPYEIGYVPGYTITTGVANGSVHVVVPTASTVDVTFTAFTGGAALNFQESGLESGTNWTVIVWGVGAITSASTRATFTLPVAGNPYFFIVPPVVGYNATPGSGSSSTGNTTAITFAGVLFTTYPVTMQAYGQQGATWSATLNGYQNTSVTSIVFWEPNGSYVLNASSGSLGPPSYSENPVLVRGVPLTVYVIWVLSPVPTLYAVAFTATAGFTGAWSVSFNGVTNSSSTGAPINFEAANGTFTYAVTVPGGMTATPPGGQGVVDGKAVAVTITIATLVPTTKYSNTTSVPTWAYEVIDVLVGLTFVLLVTTVFAWSRRPPAQGSRAMAGGSPKAAGAENPPPPPP